MAHLMIGFALLFGTLDESNCNNCAYACGQTWTNLGAPPSTSLIQNAVLSSAELTTFICGTSRDFQDPNSGGIFKRIVDNPNWYNSGLVYHDVNDLARLDFSSNGLLAATSEGLYRSDDEAETWNLITTAGSGGLRDQVSIAVSPFDSSEWILGSIELGIGSLYASSDLGENWELLRLTIPSVDITYSPTSNEIIYMAGGHFSRYNLELDSLEVLHEFFGQFVVSIEAHPSRPWIYFCAEDTIGRYDEVTGELSVVPLPGTGVAYRCLFLPPDSLIVGTEGGLYAVDENLESFRSIDDDHGSGEPLVCLDYLQAVSFSGGLHCRDLSSSADYKESQAELLQLLAFPNPVASTLFLSSGFTGQVKILNLLGQEVKRVDMKRGIPLSVDITGLTTGTYFLLHMSRLEQRDVTNVVSITVVR
ncbi:MAG: T9SS type A sorting domain-containing protein [Calditrichaeota bacterium]|nr:T9SS type A sorting domain-containing protein [Calditrichota bacterium]